MFGYFPVAKCNSFKYIHNNYILQFGNTHVLEIHVFLLQTSSGRCSQLEVIWMSVNSD